MAGNSRAWNASGPRSSQSEPAESAEPADPSKERDPEALGRQICLRMLTIAPRTRAQLDDAMRRRGIPDEAAESVLDGFTDAGLIDDAAFARAWVDSRHHGRGLSRRSLSAELRRRGVDTEDINAAVEVVGPDQEVETARRLVERKLAATCGQARDARVRRVAGMLARKGYPAGLVFRLIREALEQEGSGLEDLEDLPDPDGD